MRRFITGFVAVSLAAGSLGAYGCNAQPAAVKAVGAVQTAFDGVKDGARQVMPRETQRLAVAIAAAQADVDAGRYAEAMAAAKTLPDQVKQLADVAAKKRDEITANWDAVGVELPKALDALDQRLDELSKVHRLPAGLDVAKLESVKQSLGTMRQAWTDAQAAYQSGNLSDATTKLGPLKQAVTSAMTTVGLPVPAALGAS